MTWELDSSLGSSSPPGLLLVATSSNVNSWRKELFTMPSDGEQGFRLRNLVRLVMLATSTAATAQIALDDRVATSAQLIRGGQNVTIKVPAAIYHTQHTDANNGSSAPIAWWDNPFPLPVRGGDVLSVNVPGDANATPVQDWELYMLFDAELKRRRR